MKSTLNTPQNNAAPEIRAFIYQQLTDLEGLLPQNSNVSIVVEDPAIIKKSKKEFKKKILITLETEAGNLVVESEHVDVYKAIQVAKENLRSQLTALQSFIGGDERDQEINNIIEHRYLH